MTLTTLSFIQKAHIILVLWIFKRIYLLNIKNLSVKNVYANQPSNTGEQNTKLYEEMKIKIDELDSKVNELQSKLSEVL